MKKTTTAKIAFLAVAVVGSVFGMGFMVSVLHLVEAIQIGITVSGFGSGSFAWVLAPAVQCLPWAVGAVAASVALVAIGRRIDDDDVIEARIIS